MIGLLSHPQYPSISRFQDALQAGAGQEALIAEITVANVIQDQIPGELGQAGDVESIMDRRIEQVGQTAAKRVMLGLMCLEMRVSELAQDALLGFEVFVNQRGQVVQQRDEVAFVHAVRTPEKPVAEQQQPFVLRKERVDADLALLAQRFTCIRTYSQIGLEALPELARKHGLKMLAGAWVSANPADTELEIKALISAANTYPDVIDAVIVGNEVLLRKEATESQLVALIARVKAAVQQPRQRLQQRPLRWASSPRT